MAFSIFAKSGRGILPDTSLRLFVLGCPTGRLVWCSMRAFSFHSSDTACPLDNPVSRHSARQTDPGFKPCPIGLFFVRECSLILSTILPFGITDNRKKHLAMFYQVLVCSYSSAGADGWGLVLRAARPRCTKTSKKQHYLSRLKSIIQYSPHYCFQIIALRRF